MDDEAAAAEAGRYAGDDITIRRPTVGRATTTVAILVATLLFSGVVHAADVTYLKAAEIAFNAAQNAGNIADMAKFFLADRTIFGPGGGGLGVGWTEESLARRQAEFNAGRKIDYRVETLEVHMYGGVAASTFERIGTVKEVGGVPRASHLRISGVRVKTSTRCARECALVIGWRASPVPAPAVRSGRGYAGQGS